jgi:hypothetical protein
LILPQSPSRLPSSQIIFLHYFKARNFESHPIAKDNNTTVDAILKVNTGISNKDKIMTGQVINLPGQSNTNNDNSSQTQGGPSQNKRLELKGPGMFYRGYMGSEAGKDMFERYWLGQGDMTLTKEQFEDIVKVARMQGADKMQGVDKTLNGPPVMAKVVSFYGTKYGNSIGSGTVFYDCDNNPIGFFDYFNFDSKPWGKRSFSAELKTRLVNTDGEANGAKPFKIVYP